MKRPALVLLLAAGLACAPAFGSPFNLRFDTQFDGSPARAYGAGVRAGGVGPAPPYQPLLSRYDPRFEGSSAFVHARSLADSGVSFPALRRAPEQPPDPRPGESAVGGGSAPSY